MRAAEMIATFGGVGYVRPAPGTWGSLAAIPVGGVLHVLGGPMVLAAGVVLAFVIGWWATWVETRGAEDHDPSEIVVDEVAGQWMALLPVSFGATHADAAIWALWPGVIVAFLLFRLFDIWKPGPIGWADRKGNALGVMLDDVIAGVFAAIGVAAFAAVWHGVLGL